jgi:uncharacterized protein YpmS
MSTKARALLGLKATGLTIAFEPSADHDGSFSPTVSHLKLGSLKHIFLL